MRLIDADELLTHIEDYGEGQNRLDLIDPYYVHNATTVNAIPVPDNATNGDMIKAMFPNIETWIVEQDMAVEFPDMLTIRLLPLTWWNAPYKRGDADES